MIGTPFFIVFGALSDKIGRKPIIMAGCLLAALTYFPLFKALTEAANPELAAAQAKNKVVVVADPERLLVPVQPDRRRQVHELVRHRQAGAGRPLGELRERGRRRPAASRRSRSATR